MSNEFNTDFYVAVATINPIFFLALTVQGTFYNGLIESINSVTRDLVKAKNEKRDFLRELKTRTRLAQAILFLALGFLCAGLGGEVAAIDALYHQRASSSMQLFVIWSTIGIILLAAITPGLDLLRAYRNYNSAIMGDELASLERSLKFNREANRYYKEAKRYEKDATRYMKDATRYAEAEGRQLDKPTREDGRKRLDEQEMRLQEQEIWLRKQEIRLGEMRKHNEQQQEPMHASNSGATDELPEHHDEVSLAARLSRPIWRRAGAG